jgi:hypothetical protein
MASEQEINQRLRTLHQDFDFLLDNNVISAQLYDDLCKQIPRRNTPLYSLSLTSGYIPSLNNTGSTVPAAVPVPPPAAPSPPPSSVTTLASQLHRTSISPGAKKSPPPPPTPSSPPPYGLAQAEALYDYSSNDEGDLSLIAGQRITILEYGIFH